jgi:hypothetical protein
MKVPLNLSQPIVNPSRLRMSTGGKDVLLDGGWWPRSSDPEAELPALIEAIDNLYGAVQRMVLSADAWKTHPDQIRIGGRMVEVDYFASQPVGLLTALCAPGRRVDLLVISPGVAAETATAAMAVAATATVAAASQQFRMAAAKPDRTAERLADQVWEADGRDTHAVRRRTLQYDDHQLPGVIAHQLTTGGPIRRWS